MKKTLFLLGIFSLMLAMCGAPAIEEENSIPKDLEGKKALLKEKKTALRALQQFVNELQDSIDIQNGSPQKAKTLVTTQKAQVKDFTRFVEIQANVETDDLVNASSEVSGRITELPVEEGQYVKKGALIAKLDLESLNKQIAELEKSKELADEVYERQKRLWDQKIGSEIQYLQAKNEKERIEKSLETIKFQLTKSEVYAPISGVVDAKVLKRGEIAAPGAPIVQILNTNRVKVVADVPESYLKSIRKGEYVTIKFPALNTEKRARVSMIGRTIDKYNRTFKAEVEVANPNNLLKPNLLATMLIKEFTEPNAVTIPLNLVQQEIGGKDYVFIKGESEDGFYAKKVYVKTGKSYDNEIIITEGLEGSEDLIVTGARGLAENELIKVQNATTQQNG